MVFENVSWVYVKKRFGNLCLVWFGRSSGRPGHLDFPAKVGTLVNYLLITYFYLLVLLTISFLPAYLIANEQTNVYVDSNVGFIIKKKKN